MSTTVRLSQLNVSPVVNLQPLLTTANHHQSYPSTHSPLVRSSSPAERGTTKSVCVRRPCVTAALSTNMSQYKPKPVQGMKLPMRARALEINPIIPGNPNDLKAEVDRIARNMGASKRMGFVEFQARPGMSSSSSTWLFGFIHAIIWFE